MTTSRTKGQQLQIAPELIALSDSRPNHRTSIWKQRNNNSLHRGDSQVTESTTCQLQCSLDLELLKHKLLTIATAHYHDHPRFSPLPKLPKQEPSSSTYIHKHTPTSPPNPNLARHHHRMHQTRLCNTTIEFETQNSTTLYSPHSLLPRVFHSTRNPQRAHTNRRQTYNSLPTRLENPNPNPKPALLRTIATEQ